MANCCAIARPSVRGFVLPVQTSSRDRSTSAARPPSLPDGQHFGVERALRKSLLVDPSSLRSSSSIMALYMPIHPRRRCHDGLSVRSFSATRHRGGTRAEAGKQAGPAHEIRHGRSFPSRPIALSVAEPLVLEVGAPDRRVLSAHFGHARVQAEHADQAGQVPSKWRR